MRRYKADSPKKILVEILDIIERKKHYGRMRNWEMLVELLAIWLEVNADWRVTPLREFSDLDTKRLKDLFNHIDKQELFECYVTAARSKPWDYLGEVYIDLNLVGPGQNMTPKGIVDMMIQMVYAKEKKLDAEAAFFCYESYRKYRVRHIQIHYVPANHLRPMDIPLKTQLDPCVGTGRFLFEASLMFPKAPLVLFGIEINVSLYRACLVNMKMFSNHPYSIICANTLRLDPELSAPAGPVWALGNRWNPPDMSKFYWKPPPIRRDAFSLEAFTKLKKT